MQHLNPFASDRIQSRPDDLLASRADAPRTGTLPLVRERDRDPAESTPSLTDSHLILHTTALILLTGRPASATLRSGHPCALLSPLDEVTPALPLFLFFSVAMGAATLAEVDAALLDTVATGAGSPLWFLGAFLLTQVFAPTMVQRHVAAPIRTMLVLLAGAVLVDGVRIATGIVEIGLS